MVALYVMKTKTKQHSKLILLSDCLYPLVGSWASVLLKSSFYTADEKQNAFAHVFCMPAYEVVKLHPLHSQWREMDATRQGFV